MFIKDGISISIASSFNMLSGLMTSTILQQELCDYEKQKNLTNPLEQRKQQVDIFDCTPFGTIWMYYLIR